MAALVCDLCGGKLVMGSGGIATCDSCGMEHSPDRMKEKVQEIKGTVRVDNTHMIDNYLEMANNAYNSNNHSEAELYCNKIIEIEPANYKAWLLKGKAAGWQSTLQNSRISESVSAFAKAINNAPEDEKKAISNDAVDQIKKLSIAMISLRGDRFAKWPDQEETHGFASDMGSILSTFKQFLNQTGVVFSLSEILAPLASTVNQSVVSAYNNVIKKDYEGDPYDSDDRANKYEWQRFIERIDYCINLLEYAATMGEDNYDVRIQIYDNLISFQNKAIDSCSWDYNFTEYGGKNWYKEWQLTDQAKSIRKNTINGYREKSQELRAEKAKKEQAAAQKRFDEYWANHKKEKQDLENKKKVLEENAKNHRQELDKIPGLTEKKQLEDRIKTLTAEKDSLGFFKRKEKKDLDEKIASVKIELEKITASVNAAKEKINIEIRKLQDEIRRINTELTKPR